MKKVFLAKLCGVILVVTLCIGLAACSGDGIRFPNVGDQSDTTSQSSGDSAYDNAPEQIRAVYDMYVASMASGDQKPLSYTEWLDSIAGEKGEKGEKGDQGVGIAKIELDEDGQLVVTLTDGTVEKLGKVSQTAIGIQEVRITEDKKLSVTLNNGIVLETMPLDVTFEGSITGLSIDADGVLYIYSSTGRTQSYQIVRAYINAESEIVVVFNDGTELSFGKITGVAGTACKHEYGGWEVQIAPNCNCFGYSSRVCSKCGGVEYKSEPVTGHSFGSEPLLIQKYADGSGYYGFFDCKICGALQKQNVEAPYSVGLEYTLADTDDAYSLSGIGTCTDTKIIVPEEHEGLPVTEIGDRAFYGCDSIESIQIPETVTKVGDKAFSDCEKLADVSMPENVELGTDVFRGSIHIEIIIRHETVFVPAKAPTCYEPGNIEYYLCETCNIYYADAECKERIYDVTIEPTHNFEAGTCTECGAVQDSIKVVSVDEIAYLGKFALGTLESAIGLPEQINVHTADGKTYALPVVWALSDYNKAEVGTYTIKGMIQSDKFHFAEGVNKYVETQLEITDLMKGTADIVFVLDVSGSMGSSIDTVKRNIQEFAQKIEDQGVSVRWSLVTYSDFTCDSSYEEQSHIIQNGASNWFTSTSDYKTAIGNISLAYGGDNPEAAVDGLLLANTLEHRQDARVFYILLTDADFKNDNNYGVENMAETTQILDEKGVNVSVITDSDYYSEYRDLVETTGGVLANINNNFAQTLFDSLIPIIYEDVIA